MNLWLEALIGQQKLADSIPVWSLTSQVHSVNKSSDNNIHFHVLPSHDRAEWTWARIRPDKSLIGTVFNQSKTKWYWL
jgi:hypothetical protein